MRAASTSWWTFRVALGCAALALVACASVRPEASTATLEGEFTRDLWSSSNVEITALDGVSYREAQRAAKMAPGKRRAAIRQTLITGRKAEQLVCSFDLDVVAGCSYRPHPPTLSASLSASGESVFMPLSVRCRDTTYPTRVLADCARR